MNIKAIFDNGGKTFDRYTVIFDDGSALGLSHNPDSPLGFSQWSEAIVETKKLGMSLTLTELPEHVQRHIKTRLTYCD
jgi:hypothetical protein